MYGPASCAPSGFSASIAISYDRISIAVSKKMCRCSFVVGVNAIYGSFSNGLFELAGGHSNL